MLAPATEAKKERTTIGYALLYIDNLNYFAGADGYWSVATSPPFPKGDLGGMSRCWHLLPRQKKERTTIGYALLCIDNLNYFAGASVAGASVAGTSSVAGASSTAAGVTSISSTSNSKASLGPIN